MSGTSGTYNWTLDLSQCVLEAFDNIEIRPSAITGEMMVSARRSINLELQSWSNMGINLWAVDLQTIPLIQGVPVYNIPPETITMLDTYVRTYQLANTFNVPVNFSTTINSPTIGVTVANHGLQTGQWLNIVTPVAVGGIVLSGFYQATVTSPGTFTIVAGANATSGTSPGVVPQFTAMSGSSTVTVTLPNHGYFPNQIFNIGAQTTVGGLTLYGGYTIQTVTANTFTFSALTAAIASVSVYENGGNLNINTQGTADPVDILLTPIGRSDYAAIPDKLVQSRPTTYWYDRTINPQVTLYQVPDNTSPYELVYYRMRRIQDAYPTMGQNAEIPVRFLSAFCAGLAVRLAVKYAKAMLPVLQPIAAEALEAARTEDRERAELQILPDLSPYFRI